MNQFRICDKCKAVNTSNIISYLKKIDPNAEIIVGCQNFCGIGRIKPFVILNHNAIVAETESELIDKIKDKLQS